MNVVFISHCDFKGNSAMHIFSIANELSDRGVDSAVVVPDDPTTVQVHGKPRFSVLPYDDVLSEPLVFADGRGPDLLHAWTPRELVRRICEELARRYGIPYIVHLEDNEQVLAEMEMGGRSFEELGALPLPLLDQIVPARCAHPA